MYHSLSPNEGHRGGLQILAIKTVTYRLTNGSLLKLRGWYPKFTVLFAPF